MLKIHTKIEWSKNELGRDILNESLSKFNNDEIKNIIYKLSFKSIITKNKIKQVIYFILLILRSNQISIKDKNPELIMSKNIGVI